VRVLISRVRAGRVSGDTGQMSGADGTSWVGLMTLIDCGAVSMTTAPQRTRAKKRRGIDYTTVDLVRRRIPMSKKSRYMSLVASHSSGKNFQRTRILAIGHLSTDTVLVQYRVTLTVKVKKNKKKHVTHAFIHE